MHRPETRVAQPNGPERPSLVEVKAKQVLVQKLASESLRAALLTALEPELAAQQQELLLLQGLRPYRQVRLFWSWKTWAKRPPNLTQAG